jgi:hypothetical protein
MQHKVGLSGSVIGLPGNTFSRGQPPIPPSLCTHREGKEFYFRGMCTHHHLSPRMFGTHGRISSGAYFCVDFKDAAHDRKSCRSDYQIREDGSHVGSSRCRYPSTLHATFKLGLRPLCYSSSSKHKPRNRASC